MVTGLTPQRPRELKGSAEMTPSAPTQPSQHPLLAAAARARAESLSARRTSPTTWACKGYILTETGPRPQDIRCDCPAGSHGRVCKHSVLPIWARKYGVNFVQARPVQVPDSTPEDIALSESIKREIVAELITPPANVLPFRPPTPPAPIAHCADCQRRYLYSDVDLAHRLYCEACRAAHTTPLRAAR